MQGTPHPVSILTDHKNLSYLKDPRKLSCHQACWSLFLQDLDIIWKVTPGTQMGPADALSRKDHLDTTADSADTPILPDPMVINALNLSLSLATSNPPLPLIPLFSKPLQPWMRDLSCSLEPLFQTGHLTMAISISANDCMFLPLPTLPSSI